MSTTFSGMPFFSFFIKGFDLPLPLGDVFSGQIILELLLSFEFA